MDRPDTALNRRLLPEYGWQPNVLTGVLWWGKVLRRWERSCKKIRARLLFIDKVAKTRSLFVYNEEKLLLIQNKHIIVLRIWRLIGIVIQTRLLITQIGEMWVLYKAHLKTFTNLLVCAIISLWGLPMSFNRVILSLPLPDIFKARAINAELMNPVLGLL